jgi:hypothetical protein
MTAAPTEPIFISGIIIRICLGFCNCFPIKPPKAAGSDTACGFFLFFQLQAAHLSACKGDRHEKNL